MFACLAGWLSLRSDKTTKSISCAVHPLHHWWGWQFFVLSFSLVKFKAEKAKFKVLCWCNCDHDDCRANPNTHWGSTHRALSFSFLQLPFVFMPLSSSSVAASTASAVFSHTVSSQTCMLFVCGSSVFPSTQLPCSEAQVLSSSYSRELVVASEQQQHPFSRTNYGCATSASAPRLPIFISVSIWRLCAHCCVHWAQSALVIGVGL